MNLFGPHIHKSGCGLDLLGTWQAPGCVLMDVNLAAKDRSGSAVENALVELVTVAVRLCVFDDSIVVNVLCSRRQIESIESAFGTRAS